MLFRFEFSSSLRFPFGWRVFVGFDRWGPDKAIAKRVSHLSGAARSHITRGHPIGDSRIDGHLLLQVETRNQCVLLAETPAGRAVEAPEVGPMELKAVISG
jgi:hypothetical protein